MSESKSYLELLREAGVAAFSPSLFFSLAYYYYYYTATLHHTTLLPRRCLLLK